MKTHDGKSSRTQVIISLLIITFAKIYFQLQLFPYSRKKLQAILENNNNLKDSE